MDHAFSKVHLPSLPVCFTVATCTSILSEVHRLAGCGVATVRGSKEVLGLAKIVNTSLLCITIGQFPFGQDIF